MKLLWTRTRSACSKTRQALIKSHTRKASSPWTKWAGKCTRSKKKTLSWSSHLRAWPCNVRLSWLDFSSRFSSKMPISRCWLKSWQISTPRPARWSRLRMINEFNYSPHSTRRIQNWRPRLLNLKWLSRPHRLNSKSVKSNSRRLLQKIRYSNLRSKWKRDNHVTKWPISGKSLKIKSLMPRLSRRIKNSFWCRLMTSSPRSRRWSKSAHRRSQSKSEYLVNKPLSWGRKWRSLPMRKGMRWPHLTRSCKIPEINFS